jgi:2-dehydropantoate 2-reductase
MRIAVMGAGGTGGYFGGLLARAGEDVTFIARGAHLEAMRRRGLTVKSSLAGDFTLPVKATDNPGEIGLVDLVLFCVKTYDTEATAERIKPIIGPDTVVFSVQNGIDNWERIGRIVGPETVMCAVAQVSSVLEEPGVIAHRSERGKILLGEREGGASPRAERLLNTFQQAGIEAELRPDIQVDLWGKFVFICGFSGLTALSRLPVGPILACPETKALLRGTLEEGEAVGRACGVELPEDCVDQALALLSRPGPSGRGSMAYDLAAGRRLELEILNGTVVRLGREHGISTPCNFAIYAALKPYADGEPAKPMGGQLP